MKEEHASASIEVDEMCPPPDGTRPDATVVNTDPFVLERFPLSRVLEQIIELAPMEGPSPVELFQQVWDSMNTQAGGRFPYVTHCDDASPPSINGFPIDCPRPEATLATYDPSIFEPVALFNRFDLGVRDPVHCGEYRIVYALTGGPPGRAFMIFEGIIPNPNPSCGIEACRPIAEFWSQLGTHDPGTPAGREALADQLEHFFFEGLPGFRPVVHPDHYGRWSHWADGVQRGQIRTNASVGSAPFQMREWHLVKRCDDTGCYHHMQPVAVKVNPFRELFNARVADPRAAEFQAFFPTQIPNLASNQISEIVMSTPDRFNAGQSTSADLSEDYEWHFQAGEPPNDFSAAIEEKLALIGRSDLTAADIVRRAQTQSCHGCHQLSNNVPLGGTGNPIWPASRGFVHVNESGFLSPALWCSFLPARKQTLLNFLSTTPGACLHTSRR